MWWISFVYPKSHPYFILRTTYFSLIRILALDIGTRRTGIAYCDDAEVPLPLDTVTHDDADALIGRLHDIITQRSIDSVVIGLPLLPSGEEGKQASIVRAVGDALATDISVTYLDERYTTPAAHPDPDASAACALLTTFLERRKT